MALILFKRGKNDFGDTWALPIDSASIAVAGTDGSAEFQNMVLSGSNQLVIMNEGDTTGVGIDPLPLPGEKRVAVYPSPILAGEMLNVYCSLDEDAELTLFDVTGKKISRTHFKVKGQVSTTGLKPGIYLYQVMSASYISYGRIVVE